MRDLLQHRLEIYSYKTIFFWLMSSSSRLQLSAHTSTICNSLVYLFLVSEQLSPLKLGKYWFQMKRCGRELAFIGRVLSRYNIFVAATTLDILLLVLSKEENKQLQSGLQPIKASRRLGQFLLLNHNDSLTRKECEKNIFGYFGNILNYTKNIQLII